MSERAYFVDSVPTEDALRVYSRYFGGEKVVDIAAAESLHHCRVIEIANVVRGIVELLPTCGAARE